MIPQLDQDKGMVCTRPGREGHGSPLLGKGQNGWGSIRWLCFKTKGEASDGFPLENQKEEILLLTDNSPYSTPPNSTASAKRLVYSSSSLLV